MLHATPDNDDGCEFSRFFGDCSDILPHPWHTRTFRSLPLLTSDAALTLPLVSCAAPNLRLRVRARNDAMSRHMTRYDTMCAAPCLGLGRSKAGRDPHPAWAWGVEVFLVSSPYP